MSTAKTQRAGKERIESLGIPKPKWATWWTKSNKSNLAIRYGLAIVAAAALILLCRTWQPAFAYRLGAIPARDMLTRITFQVPDRVATDDQRERKRREVLTLYRNNPDGIDQLREGLRNQLFSILGASSYEQLGDKEQAALNELREGADPPPPGTTSPDQAPAGQDDSNTQTPAERFALLKRVFSKDPELKELDAALDISTKDLYANGVLQAPQHSPEQGSQRMIRVFEEGGKPDNAVPVELSKVRIAESARELNTKLKDEFRRRFPSEEGKADEGQIAATMIGNWFRNELPDYETLAYDDELSQEAREKAADAVETVQMTFYSGQSKLADANKPLSTRELAHLRSEWSTLVENMPLYDQIARVLAYIGMIVALYLLCGSYIWFVDDRTILTDSRKLTKLLALAVVTIVLSYYASRDDWRAELVPLVLASITAAVVYGRDFALLLMTAASLSLTLLLGADLSNFVVMMAACTSCTLLTGRIHSRTHLITVAILSAVITMLTTIGVGIVAGQTLASGSPGEGQEALFLGGPLRLVLTGLVSEAGWAGLCIVVSALAMTGLLPLVEKAFGVQTDLSLLELSDASHPLLRRLAQRAPGTYNHSINVASIAESAADAIGANGLLVRVGAYFHDIGKMFKPEYFIENQSAGINQHDSLQPAMSTLVIIAHVKDGADLARNHHLPEPIIDFILQHHGTTLVEYFYREAARRSEEDPNRESVSDKDFRYPGPKPQTLEAAVLMLADTVESASRTLVDPTPARISNLVEAIAQKKVADGQFDECGLTFSQLHRVRQSLVKSLTAIYHARVKYPGQQSA
ncbi:HD family phosphohydrolase [Allorhodopirellula solitaria]|uniref:HD/PDEase domain-containing protein n=1 Tax=Allorhodopirellula solitaria TaxID=2527987 RepID=A0A5C5YHC2_9BACT|nr:HDIG domain-containing metalloprotein [Allorhodopirellula solitaria]TWT74091.1 hypothetical protein CA85_09770 [Allorhodopirellula solitaria]